MLNAQKARLLLLGSIGGFPDAGRKAEGLQATAPVQTRKQSESACIALECVHSWNLIVTLNAFQLKARKSYALSWIRDRAFVKGQKPGIISCCATRAIRMCKLLPSWVEALVILLSNTIYIYFMYHDYYKSLETQKFPDLLWLRRRWGERSFACKSGAELIKSYTVCDRNCTHLKFNIALEKLPSQKESSLPTILFQGVKLRGCIHLNRPLVKAFFIRNFFASILMVMQVWKLHMSIRPCPWATWYFQHRQLWENKLSLEEGCKRLSNLYFQP